MELVRRVLLAVVTALLVARPLLADEDPGLLNPFSSTAGLVLALAWLVAGVGGAVWVMWSGRSPARSPLVGGTLLVVVAIVFVAALAPNRYGQPALLVGWDWLVLLVAFWLVRTLAASGDARQTSADGRRLLAVLAAGAVCLSAQAVYQTVWQLPPEWRATEANPSGLHDDLARQGFFLDNADPRLDFWTERYAEHGAFASFVQPASLAGYLVLLLPAAVGWAVLTRRHARRWWQTVVGLSCALLVAVGLWLTHRWLAVAALLVVGAGVLGARFLTPAGRRRLAENRRRVLVGLVLLAAVLVAAGYWQGDVLDTLGGTIRSRVETWSATWGMVHDHPWIGVGPGNFSRYYPRYMAPDDQREALAPHNFALEMWATCGVFAPGTLLTTLGLFFGRTRRLWTDPVGSAGDGDVPDRRVPLEYYLGGTAGMILAYVLWAPDQSPEHLDTGTIVFGCRAVLWFAVFAALDTVAWPGRSWGLAAAAGVAGLVLYLLVANGIEYASVAQPLWVVAALALNAADVYAPLPQAAGGGRLPRLLPVPVLAACCLAFILTAFVPVVGSRRLVREVNRIYGPAYWQVIQKIEANQAKLSKPKTNEDERPRLQQEIARQMHDAHENLVRDEILTRLSEAMRRNPHDTLPGVEFTQWYQQRLRLFFAPTDADTTMGTLFKRLRRLDPQGKEADLAEYQLEMQFANRGAGDRVEHYRKAADAMQRAVRLAPTEARLRFRLAEALSAAGVVEAAREQAAEALRLDQLGTLPWRKLSPAQRRKAEGWLHPGK